MTILEATLLGWIFFFSATAIAAAVFAFGGTSPALASAARQIFWVSALLVAVTLVARRRAAQS